MLWYICINKFVLLLNSILNGIYKNDRFILKSLWGKKDGVCVVINYL